MKSIITHKMNYFTNSTLNAHKFINTTNVAMLLNLTVHAGSGCINV